MCRLWHEDAAQCLRAAHAQRHRRLGLSPAQRIDAGAKGLGVVRSDIECERGEPGRQRRKSESGRDGKHIEGPEHDEDQGQVAEQLDVRRRDRSDRRPGVQPQCRHDQPARQRDSHRRNRKHNGRAGRREQ